MKSLLLLNGSPRGERSNSMRMLARVAEGWERGGGALPEVLHLARRPQFTGAVEAFDSADVVFIGMPLYTDAMPGLVKEFIEQLAEAGVGNRAQQKQVAFLVQSGFPEALHSRPLERYLTKLAARLGRRCAGTIVHGGGEALQMMPDKACTKLWEQLKTLGEQLARDGKFGNAELKAVAGTERFSKFAAALAELAVKLPMVNFYWNRQLKKNGAWERRFAAPYAAG